jgi:signal transduction histidine kinase
VECDDGDTQTFEVSVQALLDRGEHSGGVGVVRDVTGAARAERMKNQFLSVVSHELRAPLTAIKTFSTMMRKGLLGVLTLRQRRVVEAIREQSIRLEHQIDKIINLGRLESEDFEPDVEALDAAKILDSAASTFLATMAKKNLTLHREVPPNLTLHADREDLKRALQALIENAVKFTPEGGAVFLKAEKEGDDVVIEVRDTGIGIDPRFHRLVFEKYQQVENPLTRQYGGAGLGLSVARRILQAHGSDVRLKSRLGEGAAFSFRLPAARAEPVLEGAR